MKSFFLNPEYFCSVTIKTQGNYYLDDAQAGNKEALVCILAGKGDWAITSSADHPEFARLRQTLSDEGFIAICSTKSWNSDVVLKSFKLNHKTFKKGDRFLCAAALAHNFRVKK